MFRSVTSFLDRCKRGVRVNVAGTGTIAQLTGGVLNVRVFRFFVRA